MALTPMMQQYHDAKAACPGALLLFRMGDFYELFHDDARTAAGVLGLALTSREKGENAVPMAGFPYHQLEGYLRKLIAAGLRAAICEQVEDPRQAKGIVKREVTRVVTAGTLTDDALLDPRESNYLAAISGGKGAGDDCAGLSWVELSTGQFLASVVPASALADELARIGPAEILVAEGAAPTFRTPDARWVVNERPAWAFGVTAEEALERQFGRPALEGFGFDEADAPALRAAGAILEYLAETQRGRVDHLEQLLPYRQQARLEIDQATRRSLELTRSLRDGSRNGTLLEVLDRTATAMGARLLADWLSNPLIDAAAIEERLAAVAELVRDQALCDELRQGLEQVYDVERLLARATTHRATPRDLAMLKRTLRTLPALKARISARESPLLNRLEENLDLCGEIRGPLEAALEDDCPLAANEGGFIRGGYRPELDSLRELAAGGKQWIAQYQAQAIQETGISSLKVGFNKVFGYYIEVTNTHREKIPGHFIRKQTVKNAERYITPELKEYEEKVLTADERSQDLEQSLFFELRSLVAAAAPRLLAMARVLAALDVLTALAELARAQGYCRPVMVNEPRLRIVDGRHPVLDVREARGTFVPNDVLMGGEEGSFLLITGPNMAGKSTYIRQAALLTLMAQIGSWVPAKEATIGVADRIFARVGASDDLARGRSTFMVEMTETARILNMATPRSLVILDEIGRGTSTYDGLSLAWSVVEHLHDTIGCRTLFATHYHELTDLAKSLPGVRNLNVAVREWQEEVVFLHKIVPGAADKSYGIHVARLAGVPSRVLERAKDILARLESDHTDAQGSSRIAKRTRQRGTQFQLTLFSAEHPILEEIRSTNVDDLTPRQSQQLLEQWQATLKREAGSS